MILILDHQDSFTYNIYALLKSLGADVEVVNTLSTSIADIQARAEKLTGIILSPGPGHPSEAKLFFETLTAFTDKVPILGVCLGHQAIAQHFGAAVSRSYKIVHGKPVAVTHSSTDLYKDIPTEFQAMRYNSLTVERELPSELELTSWSGDDVMGLRHRKHDIEGVQFHPESIGTPHGINLLANFMRRTTNKKSAP